MTTWKIENNDVIKWAAEYQGPKFQAMLTDAPYHLQSQVERFGKENSAPAQYGTDGAFQRASRGFMGKSWDGGDVAFRSETWAALRSHMLPGAFCMAFCSTRGWHRMAVAIEDGGFIFHPSIFVLGWVQGQGFPKATNISRLLDRQAGAEREVLGKSSRHVSGKPEQKTAGLVGSSTFQETIGMGQFVTAPATEMAQVWESYRYGGQLLKPSIEPVIVFQNPYKGRPLDNITQTGAGAINIDAGRIGGGTGAPKPEYIPNGENNVYGDKMGGENWENTSGRWPANLILNHSPLCRIVGYKEDPGYAINRWEDDAHPFGGGAGNDYQSQNVNPGKFPVYECAEGCAVRALAEQGNGDHPGCKNPSLVSGESLYRPDQGAYAKQGPIYPDTGTVDRFFYQVDHRLDEVDPFFYCPKAGNDQRNAGLEPMGGGDGVRVFNSHPT